MNSGDATPELDTPICVLGAGPHGLALALHLRQADPSLAERLVVLDPTGTWMEVWRDQFRRLDIETLRSPGVHHPAPDVDALARHVTEHRLPISGMPYDLPTSAAFSHFCDHLSAEATLAPPLARRATAVHRVDDRLLVETDGPVVRTERLVVAANPHRRNLPGWVWPVLGRSRAEVSHAADVDLTRLGDPTGERIVVIGGGLTAAHLALGAARRGAEVHLVSRRPLRVRPFDTDPGWLGPKNLRAFDAIDDPNRRLLEATRARGGGSIPGWMRSELHRADDHATVHLHEGDDVAAASAGPDRHVLHLRSGATVEADRLWLATGSRPDLTTLRCLRPLLPDIALIDGVPVPDAGLRVGAPPVHVMGRLATIELGPAAGNLWGARMAARRITRAVTGIDLEQHSLQPEQRVRAPRRLSVRRRHAG